MFTRLSYFKKSYKLIENRFKQTKKNRCWSKSNTKNLFYKNLERGEGAAMLFIIGETKETVLDLSKGTVKVLWFHFVLIKYL